MAKVTLRHLRALGYCVESLREFCAEHDIKIREFAESRGVECDRLVSTGNAFAIAAARLAESEEE